MGQIKLETYEKQIESCSLKGEPLSERLKFLNNNFFSKAKNITEKENKIFLEFPYNREIAHQLTELAFFEKNCCGNFIINTQFNMIEDIIRVELNLIR